MGKQSNSTGTTPKKQNKPTGNSTTSSPDVQRKLSDYIRQNDLKHVKSLLNGMALPDVIGLLKQVIKTITNTKGLSSGNHRKRKEIIEYFIKTVDQDLSPKDCKKQKEEIIGHLTSALKELEKGNTQNNTNSKSIGQDRSNTLSGSEDGSYSEDNASEESDQDSRVVTVALGAPVDATVTPSEKAGGSVVSAGVSDQQGSSSQRSSVSSSTLSSPDDGNVEDEQNPALQPVANTRPGQVGDTQTNDGQSSNLSNTVPLVQPTTPETPNASSDGSNVPKTGDVTHSEDMFVINGASSKNDFECEMNSEQSDDKRGDSPSGSGSSSPIQDIVNEEEPVVIATRQSSDSEHDKTVSKEHQDDAAIQNTQPKTLVVDSKPSNTGVEGNGKKQAPVQPTEPVSKQPTPAPTLIPPVANNKSEQVNDTQTNGKLPNNSGNGSITATQNTKKSKLPTVATWTFAVAGILAGAAAPAAYFAFSVSLLTTGIIAGVAACCLVAALIIYCYTPKSQAENSEVEKSFNTEKAPITVSV